MTDDLTDLPGEDACQRFMGTQFSRTRRHGKYIFVGTKDGPWLHLHLGMAGSIRVMDADEADADYIRFTVQFQGGTRLHFRDPRKFGHVQVVEDVDAFIAQKGLGPDALTIGDNAFITNVGGTRGAVKSALLSQKKLAGVGNLWADEALYRTGIAPDAKAADLASDRVQRLHGAVRDILQSVVDTDATYSRLPADWLIHNRADGAACTRCDGTITTARIGGRTSYHCPDHQVGA